MKYEASWHVYRVIAPEHSLRLYAIPTKHFFLRQFLHLLAAFFCLLNTLQLYNQRTQP